MSTMLVNRRHRNLKGSGLRVGALLAVLQAASVFRVDVGNVPLLVALSHAEAMVLSVSVNNSTFAFGTTPANTWLTPQTAVITNDGTVAESFAAKISQPTTGTNTWALSTTANGVDVIRAQWSTNSATGPWTDISAYDIDSTIATNVAVSGSVTLWLRIQTPTSTASYNQYSSTLTVTASVF